MDSLLQRLGRFAFALVTLAVLGLGAAQVGSATATVASVSSVAAKACEDPYIGECSSELECDRMCTEAGYENEGDCASNGCCMCFE